MIRHDDDVGHERILSRNVERNTEPLRQHFEPIALDQRQHDDNP